MFSQYPDVLTIPQLQEALSIGRNTAYKLINNNEIKSIRVGKIIRIPKVYVQDYVTTMCYNNCDVKGEYCHEEDLK